MYSLQPKHMCFEKDERESEHIKPNLMHSLRTHTPSTSAKLKTHAEPEFLNIKTQHHYTKRLCIFQPLQPSRPQHFHAQNYNHISRKKLTTFARRMNYNGLENCTHTVYTPHGLNTVDIPLILTFSDTASHLAKQIKTHVNNCSSLNNHVSVITSFSNHKTFQKILAPTKF